MSHWFLLAKFQTFGSAESLLRWIEDFLSRRSFIIHAGATFSGSAQALSGVTQGFMLGPLRFIIFMNGQSEYFERACSMFEDDLMLFFETGGVKNLQADLQHFF